MDCKITAQCLNYETLPNFENNMQLILEYSISWDELLSHHWTHQCTFRSKVLSMQNCISSQWISDVFVLWQGKITALHFIYPIINIVSSCWHTIIDKWDIFLVFLPALLPGCLLKKTTGPRKLLIAGFRVFAFQRHVPTFDSDCNACMLGTSATHWQSFTVVCSGLLMCNAPLIALQKVDIMHKKPVNCLIW